MGAHWPEKSISCAKAATGAVEIANVTIRAAPRAAPCLFMARKHTARLSRELGTLLASIAAERMSMDRSSLIRVGTVLIVCTVVAVVWSQLPTATWDLDAISGWMAPH